ncbi:transposable element Tc3 transposase [Trichonephila clavipes]|nr:transposable element Tc3 transposase [Trichonephila clavipes]
MLNGQTELHIFDRGSVTGDRYCEEVLLPHVCLFRGAIGPDFIFMDDNARPHRTLAIEELLESENITRMDWPAYSPDLNPIEHVWDALGKRIAARLHHPEITQLKQMLIEEWALLPVSPLLSYLTAKVSEVRGSIRIINSLDSDEIDVEIAVLPPDANELIDKDEGDENEVNTGEITENDVPRSGKVRT